MKKILITGGTVFVSRFTAEWFAKRGYEVFVLNRGNRKQPKQTKLIKADRHALGECLKGYAFDAVLDITAYDEEDVRDLLEGLLEVRDYILISSSAVYPEYLSRPFCEEQPVGENTIWGSYGLNKIKAEQYLLEKKPEAYILRPPYLYGPMQNLYREPFVFDCAMKGRPFYIPGDGSMPLQFFHVEDLCRLMEILLNEHPDTHVMNVGNSEIVDINRFVDLCYEAAGEKPEKIYVKEFSNQRDFFCFHEYAYTLNVDKQRALLPVQKSLEEGLRESLAWYRKHEDEVVKKEYISYIEKLFQADKS